MTATTIAGVDLVGLARCVAANYGLRIVEHSRAAAELHGVAFEPLDAREVLAAYLALCERAVQATGPVDPVVVVVHEDGGDRAVTLDRTTPVDELTNALMTLAAATVALRREEAQAAAMFVAVTRCFPPPTSGEAAA